MSLDEPNDLAESEGPRRRSRTREVVGTVLAVLLVLAAAVAISYWIKASEPTAQREAATRRSAALVETLTATRGTHRPTVRVLGSVMPAREIILSPRVGGEIVEVDAAFEPGGLVSTGDPMLRIDPADYEQALVMREGELGQVEAELAIEEGRQRVAEREFQLLGQEIAPPNRSLVLREPQIASLRSKLRVAQAALRQARLALERSEVRAPFDAQLVERFIELGSQVSAGDPLARLVGTDEYWVVATVPLGVIRWIPLPKGERPGARAMVRHRSVWEDGQYREGVVERLIGEVDQSTRLARIIVSVRDPLGGDGVPPLILGTVVQVEIDAREIEDVVRLDRAYLRQGDTIWVMDGGELRIRAVDVVFSDSTHAYVRTGVDEGEKIVTTSLATVVDGLAIREALPPPEGGADAEQGGGEDGRE